MQPKLTGLYPFLPAGPDYPRALEFFRALGFELVWDAGGCAGLRCGGAYFILQDIHVPVWQANQMVVAEVEDLDLYWDTLQALGLEGRFPGVTIKPPTDYPWGREVHLIDPAGLCWHFRQSMGARG